MRGRVAGVERHGAIELHTRVGRPPHVEQHVAEGRVNLHLADGRHRQIVNLADAFGEAHALPREDVAADVPRQQLLELAAREAELTLAGVFERGAVSKRRHEAAGVRDVLLLLAEQQIVHERPRLRVEDRRARRLVVERRLVVDLHEIGQRDEVIAQQQHVIRVDFAERRERAVGGDLERAVRPRRGLR